MAQPSDKSAGMESSIGAIFGFDRREMIKQNRCVPIPIGCNRDTTILLNHLTTIKSKDRSN